MVSYTKRIEWYANQGTAGSAILITDDVSLVVKRGLNSKGNKTDITLKNGRFRNSAQGDVHKYTTAGNNLQFQQNDILKVFLKQQTTADDSIDTGVTSLDLITTATVEEFKTLYTEKKSHLKVGCMDKTFEMLNNLWAEAFTDGDSKTAPQIIQSVIRSISDGIGGEGFDANGVVQTYGLYSIDARLFSEGIGASGTTTSATTKKLVDSGASFTSTVSAGDMVRNTSTNKYTTVESVDSDTTLTLSKDIMTSGVGYQVSDGFIQDTRKNGTAFPTVSMSKVWRAVYEWIEDLSDIRSTNTGAEVDGTIVQDRTMVYSIDHKNRFRWIYPDDDSEYDITTGEVSTDNIRIRSLGMTKKTFDIINMVIFNGGEDLDSVGTLNYFYDENTEQRTLKMKYVPMLDLSVELREDEVDNGGITVAADNVVTITASYNYTTSWGEVVTNDATYKEAFRNEVIRRGKRYARNLTRQRANPRWAKSITTDFFNFRPGELLKITSREYGIQEELVRIQDVTHNIEKSAWTTTLDVEEDEPRVGETA